MPGGSKNQPLWEHSRINEIFQMEKQEPDQAERGAMIGEVEQILLQEIGSWFTIAWVRPGGMMLNKKVKNYFPPDGTLHQALGHEHIWKEQN